MKVLALGASLKSADESFIKSIFINTIKEEPKIRDVLSHRIITEDDQVVVTFGKKAQQMFSAAKQKCLLHLPFPEIKLLEPSPENEVNRQYVYDQLMSLEGSLANRSDDKVITTESLPATSTEDLIEAIKKIGTKEWRGQTKDGKTIKLTPEPTKDNPADVNLTFAEFFVLQAAMETLQIKEFQIVYSSKPKE